MIAVAKLPGPDARSPAMPPATPKHSKAAAVARYGSVSTAKNAAFKKVYDSMTAFRKDQVLWFRVAEGTFDNFMARQSAANKL